MEWLDNAQNYWGQSAQDLGQSSYDAQRRQLDYRNLLAQMLLRQQAPQGQMVGRQYVAPSGISQGLAALQQAAGMVVGGRNASAEGDLESKDAALRQAALKASFAPSPEVPTVEGVRKAVVQQKDQQYRDMNANEMQRMQGRLLTGQQGPSEPSNQASSDLPDSYQVAGNGSTPYQATKQSVDAQGTLKGMLAIETQARDAAAAKGNRAEQLQRQDAIDRIQRQLEIAGGPAVEPQRIAAPLPPSIAAGAPAATAPVRQVVIPPALNATADRTGADTSKLATAAAAVLARPTDAPTPTPAVAPRLSYEDVLAQQAVDDGSALSTATDQRQKFVDALKARDQAQRDSVFALSNGSKDSQKLQMALLERSIKSKPEYASAQGKNGQVILYNKQDANDTRTLGSNGMEVKPSDVNTYRVRESQLRGDISTAKNAVDSMNTFQNLSRKLDINWAGGGAWEAFTAKVGANPEYNRLKQVITSQVFPALQQMKGATSDKEMQNVFATMPAPDATEKEKTMWFVDNMPKIQANYSRLSQELAAHQQDGAAIGVAPIMSESSGAPRDLSAWMDAVGKPQGR